MRLPGGADAQVVIRVLAVIVVDVEAVLIEVANVHEVAVRRLHHSVLCPLRALGVVLAQGFRPVFYLVAPRCFIGDLR